MTTVDGELGLRLVPSEWSTGDPESLAALLLLAARPRGRRRSWLMYRMLLAADLLALALAFLGASALVGADGAPPLPVLVVALPAWIVAAKLYGLYERDTTWAAYSTTEELAAVLHLLTVGAWSIVVVEWLAAAGTPRLSWLLIVWLLSIPAVGAARAVARGMGKQAMAYRQNAIVVGAGDVGQLVARKLLQHPEYGINVVGLVDTKPRARRRELDHVPLLGATDQLRVLVEDLDVERVIVAFSAGSDAETVGLVRALSELDRDVQVDLVPRLFELVGPRAFVHSIEGLPLVGIPPLRQPRSSRALKRALDAVGAAVVLVLTAPLILLVAILIKRDSEGPVFFHQERLGRDMRPFDLLKFRTMAVDTDPAEHLAYIRETMTAAAVPRANGLYKLDRSRSVTRVGRWLRRTSLDELPQLINVLRGDMSLVGPRPCLATETELFSPHHFERFLVPAGLTGLWQVTARAKSTFGEALDMDVTYARGWSLLLDLRLLLRTPLQLLRPRRNGMTRLRFGVIGLGYWGPNLVRNLHELEDAEVAWICDRRPEALRKISQRYPAVRCTERLDDLLEDPTLDAVLVATPVSTHYPIAAKALGAGKHVFVEKPLAASSEEAEALIALAERREVVLMPGHTFLYSPPVNMIRSLIQNGELGEIYFVSTSRVNLGLHQPDVSVAWDLGPHDFSILRYWLGETPAHVAAASRGCVLPQTADVAFINLEFASGIIAHVELAWLAPSKLRRTTVVGSEKMVVYDDTSNESVRIFDAGVTLPDPASFGEYRLTYRTGSIVSPRVEPLEPLLVELDDFCTAIRTGLPPRSNAHLGLEVVRMIEAVDRSLAAGGARVPVDGEAPLLELVS